MKVAVLFDRFGPYHIARLEAAAKYLDIIPIEISGETSEYQWDKVDSPNLQKRITLFNKDSRTVASAELVQVLEKQLTASNPDVVAVNGWFDRSAIAALKWCLKNDVPAVVMSESAEEDGERVWWKESLKKRIVSRFNAALAGGIRHKKYLEKMGFPTKNIFLGYDAVDNEHFIAQSDAARANKAHWQQQLGLPENYFIVVSRFIEKKNLPFVITAFHAYSKKVAAPWHLYILGDGEMKQQLLSLVQELKLEHLVHFEGFKQYNELPIYFGLAKAFVHASTVEQWGLVVNEAMASGLPVVVSERCGCVPELVHNGVNGFSIDPYNQEQLSQIMERLSADAELLEKMAGESRRIVQTYGADAFGSGLYGAANAAVKSKNKKASFITGYLMDSMINR